MRNATRIELVAAGLAAWVPIVLGAGADWAPSYADALRLAKEQGKPLMVEFTTPYCGPCKRMEKEVLPAREVKPLLDQFIKVQANVLEADMKAIFRSHKFNQVPSFAFLRPTGKPVLRISGPRLADEFARDLGSVLAKERALAAALQRIEANGPTAQACHGLGVAYADVGEDALAQEQFAKVVAAQPSAPPKPLADAHYRLGKAMAGTGRLQQAMAHFDSVAKLDPKNQLGLAAPAVIGKGRVALAQGNAGLAYRCFDQVIKKMKTSDERGAEALYYLGKCYERMGNKRAAVYTWRRCAQVYPRTKYGKQAGSGGR